MNLQTFTKRIMVITMVLLLIAGIVNASSAEHFSNINLSMDYSSDGVACVSVSGSFDAPEIPMVFLTLEPNVDPEDVDEDANGICHQELLYSDINGKFLYSFSITDSESAKTGVYNIYCGTSRTQSVKLASFYYMNSEDMKIFMDNLVGASADELTIMLESEDNVAALRLDGFSPYEDIDKELFAKRFCASMKNITDTDNPYKHRSAVCTLAREIAAIELLNQNIADNVFDSEGEFVYSDVVSVKSVDAILGITVYDFYKNAMDSKDKAIVQADLFGKDFSDAEDMLEAFAHKVILHGVNHSTYKGYRYLESLLSPKNCKFLGLNVESISESQMSAISECTQNFETVKQLEEYINSIDYSDDNSGGKGSSSGGGGGGGGSYVKVENDYLEKLESETSTKPASIFADIDESHWAAEAVSYLKAKTIINGKNGNVFDPTGFVTREEFVKMICVAFGVSVPTDLSEYTTFDDVDSTVWYAPYVYGAKDAGIANGVSDTQFGSGVNITRQDLCVMAYRAAGYIAENNQIDIFADKEQISSYALEPISHFATIGILNGYNDGTFKPKNMCTRAEAAQILYNILKKEQN